MNIHENIRNFRKQRHLTQEELAEAMAVSCAAVSKWENGQCAPDLATLAALADYFEVSVDTLLDHRVSANRMEALLAELDEAVDRHDGETASVLCDRLLRNYPNEPKVADRCALACYQLFIYTQQAPYMEKCIVQTKRLFTLNKGESDADRMERLRYLANQYELLEKWEEAKDYYERGGDDGGCVARCLLNLGRREEALTVLSDYLVKSIFRQHLDIGTLADIWTAAGDLEKACQAKEWMIKTMEAIEYTPTVIQLELAGLASLYLQMGNEKAAGEAVRKAKAYSLEPCDEKWASAPFLKPGKPQKLLISENTMEFVERMIAHCENL